MNNIKKAVFYIIFKSKSTIFNMLGVGVLGTLMLVVFQQDQFYSKGTDYLGMNIYLWKEDIEDGASVMTVEYRPVEYGKDYDVVNNPDIFELYIDGKEVKE